MAIKTTMLTVGIAAAAILGAIGAASACGCKTKFERTKPHVNVSGSAADSQGPNALKAPPRGSLSAGYGPQFYFRTIDVTNSRGPSIRVR